MRRSRIALLAELVTGSDHLSVGNIGDVKIGSSRPKSKQSAMVRELGLQSSDLFVIGLDQSADEGQVGCARMRRQLKFYPESWFGPGVTGLLCSCI